MGEAKEMHRAHALLQVKRADMEARRITGIASTPTTDRQGDILEPQGAIFNLPFPLLLNHDHTQPLGEVIDARATPQGVYVSAQIAPEGISEKIDEAWRMIRAGLIKGLSVGFIGRASQPLRTGGRRFTEWEVIELSAVVVPANADAAILEVKRADATGGRAPETAGVIPPYPRHLSKAERAAILEKAARDLIGEIVENTAKALGQPEATVRAKHVGRDMPVLAEMMVRLRWHEERIAAMEAQHGTD